MSADERHEHVDPELVALAALGEALDTETAAHLDACPECRQVLDELRLTVAVGRSSIDDDLLVEPRAQVWATIADDLALADRSPFAPAPTVSSAAPAALPRQRRRRRGLLIAVAAVAVAAVTVGVVAVWNRSFRTTEIASARLDPLPGWLGADGDAVIEETPDGSREVRVTLEAGDEDGYREVWLLTADAKSVLSLGVLNGQSGTFAIPADVDLAEYGVVDISLEQPDGDPTHSGDSIVRGSLS
jgi:anti-sigma-K factor RskA